MTEPIDRRRFLGQSLAASIALELAANSSRAASTVEALLAQVDPQLLPARSLPPTQQNAYHVLQELARTITGEPLQDRYLGGLLDFDEAFHPLKLDTERDDELEAWVDGNNINLGQLESALAIEYCEYPSVDDCEESSYTESPIRRLARLLFVEARRALAYGDCEDAAQIVETTASCFRKLRLGGGYYHDYERVSVCEFSLRSILHEIAADPMCDDATLHAMLVAHPICAESQVAMTRCLQSELCRLFIPELARLSEFDARSLIQEINTEANIFVSEEELADKVRMLHSLLAGHTHPFDAQETARLASCQTLSLLADLDSPWCSARDREYFCFPELSPWPCMLGLTELEVGDISEISDRQIAEARKKLLGVHNVVGKKLVEVWAGMNASALQLVRSEQARYDGTRIVLALWIYARRHGEWPDNLERLCDELLLDSLPSDPFSGKSYCYSKALALVWSVGEDDALEKGQLIWRLPPIA